MANHKKDIHKIDNWLIRAGWLVVIGLLFTNGCTAAADDKGVMDLASSMTTFAFAIGAVVLLIAGYSIRRHENRVVAVWNILDHATEVSIAELERSTGFARPFIESALHTINRQPGSYYVFDPEADTIVDGRMRSRILVVKQCENCGANVNMQVSLDLPQAPTCGSCGSPVTTGDLNQIKLVPGARTACRGRGQEQKDVFGVVVCGVVVGVLAGGGCLRSVGVRRRRNSSSNPDIRALLPA